MASLSWPLAHADLLVPAGGTMNLGGGTADLACTDVTVGGTLMVGGTMLNVRNFTIQPGGIVMTSGGSIDVGGNWSNQGQFGTGSTVVRFRDLCSNTTATVSGNTTFSSVSFASTIGKTYRFEVGTTQTISTLLDISGTAGNPVQIASSSAGAVANMNLQPGGTQTIQHVGVTDVWATGQWLAPYLTNEGGGANANRWFGVPDDAVRPVPTLSREIVAALAAMMAILGAFAIRRRDKCRLRPTRQRRESPGPGP